MRRNEILQCQDCGNLLEIQHAGSGVPSCCGQPMNLLVESTADTSLEKHVPYVQSIPGGYLVKVGRNQNHPMMEAHFIQWIELQTRDTVYRKYLKPGDLPEAEFQIGSEEKILLAREFCNLHGLWKSTH